ncbi:MAG: response regulator, partial [Chloroflexota bacterium]|nr:response regulator [Chloroflexota bacterium]
MRAAKKILVVDDEPTIRDVVVALLEDEGYAVVAAHTGLRALELLPLERPDLVIMDVMMPGLDGREVFRRMRESRNGHAPPVVMMSAAVDRDLIDPSVAAFLPKPFDLT